MCATRKFWKLNVAQQKNGSSSLRRVAPKSATRSQETLKPLKLLLRLFLKKEIQVVPCLKICSTSKSRLLCYILAATKYAYENVAGNSVVLRGFCFLLLGDFSSLATLLQWKSPWKSSHLVCHTHTLLFYTQYTHFYFSMSSLSCQIVV